MAMSKLAGTPLPTIYINQQYPILRHCLGRQLFDATSRWLGNPAELPYRLGNGCLAGAGGVDLPAPLIQLIWRCLKGFFPTSVTSAILKATRNEISKNQKSAHLDFDG